MPKLKKLGSLPFWFDDDFSANVRHARKMLWEYGKPPPSPQTRVRLVLEKLFIGDRMFLYNSESGVVTEHEGYTLLFGVQLYHDHV